VRLVGLLEACLLVGVEGELLRGDGVVEVLELGTCGAADQLRARVSTNLYAVVHVCPNPAPATEKAPQKRGLLFSVVTRQAEVCTLQAWASVAGMSLEGARATLSP
jgi:hypothetical protein